MLHVLLQGVFERAKRAGACSARSHEGFLSGFFHACPFRRTALCSHHCKKAMCAYLNL